ncbi:MAG: flagellar biosynthesis protein FlhB [Pirellulales bacterium]
MDDGDKSQDATPHRRQQAREEGQVVKSQDLAAAVLLLIGLIGLLNFGGTIVDFFFGLGTEHWGGQAWSKLDAVDVNAHWWRVLLGLSLGLLPILGMIFVGGIAVNLFQTGILYLPDKLMPDWSRIDPLAGMGRIFSLQNGVGIAQGMMKIGLIGTIAYFAFINERQAILDLGEREINDVAKYMVEAIIWICIKVVCALIVLSLMDYLWQWWRHEQNLKMSTEEVREEMKNMQGDPQTIQRRKQIQRQLAQNRVKSAVPTADVVITNPTELAIAIQYDPETMRAPIVVAKGAGVMAQRIRRLALENNIPILEKKPLAQALYKDVDVNHPIPDALYGPVAEILAYVYQLKGKSMPKQAG